MNQSANQNEVETLTQGYLEGSLTPSESPRLLALLKEDPARVKLILANLQTDALIKEVVDQSDWIVRTSTAAAPSADEILPANLIEEIDFSALSSLETLAQPRPSTRCPLVRWSLALAASVAFFVGLSVWLFPVTDNTPRLAAAPGTRVTLERGGQATTVSDAVALAAGDVLRTGDATGSNAVTLHYGRERTQISLSAESELKVLNWAKGKHLELREGKLEATVARQRLFRPMVVTTPNAEARVLGTEFSLTVTTNHTRLEVAAGRVRLTRRSDGAAVKVNAGHYAIVAGGTELNALPQTGAILREIWTGIPGGDIRDLLEHPDYPAKPAHRDLLKTFETPVIETNNFGCRLVGYLHPPVTGNYMFWIASGGDATLWLSPDDDPSRTVAVASAPGGLLRAWDAPGGLSDVARPQSPKIPLVAGRCYFIQVVQKTVSGSSYLAVAWQPPDGQRQVISGEFLSPFKPNPKEKKP